MTGDVGSSGLDSEVRSRPLARLEKEPHGENGGKGLECQIYHDNMFWEAAPVGPWDGERKW